MIENNKLESIHLFKGDLHHGRCVSSLKFKNGRTLYYKPRNADNEIFLLSFIKTLNNLGLDVSLGIPKVINGEKHSWHLHISNCECDEVDLPKYYYNWGILQCLFYILGTQDIIPDNIICCNGIPYVIDCESLILRPYFYNDSNPLSIYLQKSVLKTGILPDWMFDNETQRTSISSVLLKFRDQNVHLPHTLKKICPMSRQNIPDFLNGFSHAYLFITKNKNIILNFLINSGINNLFSRVLIHPTMIYSCLLEQQMSPEYLAGVKKLQPLLSILIRYEVYGIHTESITKSLNQQIISGSVPYFYSAGDSISLFTNNNQCICCDFYKHKTNLDWIAYKLDTLSQTDLSYQLNIIEETLNFFFDVVDDKIMQGNKELRNLDKAKFQNSYLLASTAIYNRMKKYEIFVGGFLGYVSRTKCIFDGAYQIGLQNNSIYDGMAGICMYYMTLYQHSLNQELLNKAQIIFLQIRKEIQHLKISTSEYKSIPISPLTGISGILYLMECYPKYFMHIPTYTLVIRILQEIIPFTEQYDFMSGITGLICFLYQAKNINATKKSKLMNLCGKRLLELSENCDGMLRWNYLDGSKYTSQRSMSLGGYSHGSASISVALYMLYLETNDKAYKEAFDKTLKHDRSFYSEDIHGWLDGRDLENNMDSGSWCHGSSGIALSRLQLISLGYYDSKIKEEFRAAIIQIKKRLDCNLCICHGVMGNLEILHALKNCGFQIDCNLVPYEQKICDEIRQQLPIWCGDDNYNSQIGLFMGISGIGYQFIRLNHWSSTPSVMCLEIGNNIKIMH